VLKYRIALGVAGGLLRDYAANLSLLLGMTAAVALVLYALRVLRERRPANATLEDEGE
jgi:hypothetical protein